MRCGLAKEFSFLDDSHRCKSIFLLLLRSEGYKTSESLAADLNVTSRTIKNDLKYMKRKLDEIGIQLISERAKGYRLVIENEAQGDYIKGIFQIYQPTAMDDEFDIRVQYIIRRLLVSDAPIKVEMLQDELYRNTTNSIHRELARVKSFLKNYCLALFVKPHRGMWIEGDPFYRTVCLIRMYRYFNKMISPEFNIAKFNQLFQCDEVERNQIRYRLLETITKSRIVFSDIYAERFVVYLIYFRNKDLSASNLQIDIPDSKFDYKITDEYEVVRNLVQKLQQLGKGFEFSDVTIMFLTCIAVMSTDLYRFKDCTRDKYGVLVDLAEEATNYILLKLSAYLNANMFDDYTGLKDLWKVMIPIGLKMEFRLSDDVDLGFHNMKAMKNRPVLSHLIQKVSEDFYGKYDYQFSIREQYLIFSVLRGMINRIVLSHNKLNLAVIAIDGRLSTQQLKFNLRRHFSEFINKIETKVLYELELMEKPEYDYYLCMEYGKNMKIGYKPIYFADEELAERDYVASLKHIFFDAYGCDEILPPIKYVQIANLYRFDIFPIQEYLDKNSAYEHITIGNKENIRLYLNFHCKEEIVKIFYFANPDDITLYGEKYFIIVNMSVDDNRQKLKMILNVFDRISEKPYILFAQCREQLTSYKNFFVQN